MLVNDKFIKDFTPLVRSLLQNKGIDTEDMVQDVFEKAILYQDYYEDTFESTIQSWLGLLVTHVFDRHVRDGTIEVLSLDDSSEAMQVTEEDLLYSVNDHFYSSNKEEVDYFIDLLPPKQRDTVYLKLVLGYTYKEISKSLGVSESGAQTNFSAGVKNLRKLLISDDPDHEVLIEPKILGSYGDKPYAGDWAWRPNESPDRSPSKVKIFTPEEIKQYGQDNNVETIYD